MPSALFTVKLLMGMLIAVIIFHILVLAGAVPTDIVWGGKVKDPSALLVMESISLLLNIGILGLAVYEHANFKAGRKVAWTRVAFWALAILFGLNTLGNLFAETTLEKAIFTPQTALLALLCLRIALANPGKSQ